MNSNLSLSSGEVDYFHLIIQNNPDLICRYNLQKKFEFINDTIESISGRKPEYYIGKSFHDFGYPPSFLKSFEAGFDACVQTRTSQKIEIYAEGGEVSDVFYQINFVPILKKENDFEVITGVFSVSRDITKEKRLKIQMEQQIKDLDVLAKRVLIKSNKLQNFAYIVSHNLRSNLANITSLTNLYDESESQEEKSEFFELLKGSNRRLVETLDDLSEIVKINQTIDFELQDIPLNEMIKHIELSLFQLIQQTGTEIHTDFSECDSLNYHKVYLESIIQNLITNAIKYRHPDRKPVIELITRQTEKGLIFQCKDNGIGIDLARHGSKIFELHRTFHGNQDARGVGLFITKNQIEALGGSISVESTPGEGSTFTIVFSAGED